MALCRHDNVLALLACFVCDTELWLVMPLMDKGSCHHIIRTRRRLGLADDANPGLPEAAVRAILAQLLEALAYLHAQKQIHRDVKAGNILLSTGGAVKIADFGVAGWLHENITREDGRRDTFVGTPCWMAPEVMEQTNGYNERADIWSVGITALELATGSAPYADLPPMHVLLKTLNEPPPTLATYTTLGKPAPRLSADFSRFVARCLVKDPARRPSAAELLREKYMAKADMAPLTAMLAPLPTVSAPTSPPTPMPSSAPAAGSAAATAGLGVRAGAASDLGAGLGGPDDGSDWCVFLADRQRLVVDNQWLYPHWLCMAGCFGTLHMAPPWPPLCVQQRDRQPQSSPSASRLLRLD